jgi:hypothetical protein
MIYILYRGITCRRSPLMDFEACGRHHDLTLAAERRPSILS